MSSSRSSDWLDAVRLGNAFEGPYRRTPAAHALTVSMWIRLRRRLRYLLLDRRPHPHRKAARR
jgi:hypothetical protein